MSLLAGKSRNEYWIHAGSSASPFVILETKQGYICHIKDKLLLTGPKKFQLNRSHLKTQNPSPLQYATHRTLTYSPAISPKQHSDMSHFGRSGPPDIRDTSLSSASLSVSALPSSPSLLLSYFYKKISLTHKLLFFLPRRHHRRRSFPLFDKYGKVVDVFIPRDRRYVNKPAHSLLYMCVGVYDRLLFFWKDWRIERFCVCEV